jgi:hypothetical protein
MATIDEVYIHKSRLYFYKSGGGWFVTTGREVALFYDYEINEISKGNLFDLKGSNYWKVEEGSEREYREAIKIIFRKDLIIEL